MSRIEPVIVKYIAEIDRKSFDNGVKFAKQVRTQMQKDSVIKFTTEISQLKAKLKEAQALLSAETKKENKAKLSIDATAITKELKKITKQFQSFLADVKKNAKVKVDIDVGRPSASQVQQVINDSGLDKGVKNSFDGGKKIDQKVLVKVVADTIEFDNQLKQVRAKIKVETDKDNLIKLRLEEKLIKEQLTQANREFKNLSANADTALSRLQAKFNQVTASIGNGARTIVAELGKIGTAFKQQGAGAGVAQLGGSITKGLGSIAGSLASGALSVAGGLGIVAGVQQLGQYFTTATAQARAFEKGMANINTVLNLGQKELKALGKDVLNLSNRYGRATEEIQNLVFEIASAGNALENIPSLAETSLRSAIASGESSVDVFKGVNAVIKAYGGGVGNASIIADKFFKGNIQGQLTVGELSREIQGVTGSARALGISLDEVIAGYTLFTGVVGNSSEVTTGLSRIFDSLSSPGTQALETLEAYRISYNKLQAIIAKPVDEGGGFLNAVKLITDAVGNNNLALGKIFNNVNAYKLATVIATKSNEDFAKSVDGIADSTGALDKALAEATKTQDFQITLAENKWRNAQTNIGNYIVLLIGNILSLGKSTALGIQIFAHWLNIGIITAVQALQTIGAKVNGFFVFISKSIGVFGNNVNIALENAFTSIGPALSKVFNLVLNQLESFINKYIGRINALTKGISAIAGVSIDPIKELKMPTVDLTKATKKAYQELPKLQEEINSRLSAGLMGEDKIKVSSNAVKDLKKQLEDVKKTDITRLFDDLAKQAKELEKGKAGFDDGTGDKDKNDKAAAKEAKRALDEKLKQLDLAYQKEVALVKKSTLSEIQKADKIVKLYEDTEKKKAELQDKYNKSVENANKSELDKAKDIQKEYEDLRKKGEKAYEDTTEATIKALDAMIDFEQQQDKIEANFEELKDKAKETLREITNDLNELNKETAESLADQSVKNKKDLAQVTQDLKDASRENTGINLNDVPRSITDIQKQIDLVNQQIVNLNPGDSWTKEVLGNLVSQRKELQGYLDDLNQYQKINKDNALIDANTTPAQKDEAKRLSEMTDAEKTLYEAEKKRQALTEKKKITEAFNSSTLEKSNIVETENGVSVIDDKGNITEITDFKNQEYARDLLNQQNKLKSELIMIQDQKSQQLKLVKDYYADITRIDGDYTIVFGENVKQQEALVQRLIDKQRELNSLRAGGSGGSVTTNNTTTTNIEQNNNIQSSVDFNSALRSITNRL